MGWAYCGQDDRGREIGYGVVATCDFPGCTAEIDRGLGHVCGPMHGHCEWGCGGYFCDQHRDGGVHNCPSPARDEDESPCPDDGHEWTGQQLGGPSDVAESAEWVKVCRKCGAEYAGD